MKIDLGKIDGKLLEWTQKFANNCYFKFNITHIDLSVICITLIIIVDIIILKEAMSINLTETQSKLFGNILHLNISFQTLEKLFKIAFVILARYVNGFAILSSPILFKAIYDCQLSKPQEDDDLDFKSRIIALFTTTNLIPVILGISQTIADDKVKNILQMFTVSLIFLMGFAYFYSCDTNTNQHLKETFVKQKAN